MVIYGYNSKNINSVELPNERPESCGDSGVTIVLQARYVHIFWVPVFSIGRHTVAVCHENGNELKKKHYTKRMKEEIDLMKDMSKVPIYHFAGLAIVLAVIAFFYFQSKADKKAELGYANNPKVGDLYFWNDGLDGFPYYLSRVISVKKPDVVIQFANEAYNIKEGVEDDFKSKKYRSSVYFSDSSWFRYKISFLDSLRNEGDIFKIERDTFQQEGIKALLEDYDEANFYELDNLEQDSVEVDTLLSQE